VKKITLSTVILSTLVFYGCESLDGQTVLIDYGMSKRDVIEIMGVPQDRQMKGFNEAFQYCQSGTSFGANSHQVVYFYKGNVVGLNSYKTSVSGCTGGMRTINWESLPDYTIEHRMR
jgi:hypothetical protein